jgi:putative Mg2+ transporter-C (MgtC) family protein
MLSLSELLTIPEFVVAIRLVVALLLGIAIGVEREISGHTAGIRTHALVTMGAALFVSMSYLLSLEDTVSTFDPTRIASQVVVGIGFIGAGVIIFRNDMLHGLTTAAGLWVAAGVGVAAGLGYIFTATFSAMLVILTLMGMKKLKQ